MTDLPRYRIGTLSDYDIRSRSYVPDIVEDAHGGLVKWADVSSRLQQLEEAASERDAIASLVSDREEAGTYPKVEGLLTRVEQLEQEKVALLAACKTVIAWFEALSLDQHEKLVLGQTLESASENWYSLVTPPLDLEPMMVAVKKAEGR